MSTTFKQFISTATEFSGSYVSEVDTKSYTWYHLSFNTASLEDAVNKFASACDELEGEAFQNTKFGKKSFSTGFKVEEEFVIKVGDGSYKLSSLFLNKKKDSNEYYIRATFYKSSSYAQANWA